MQFSGLRVPPLGSSQDVVYRAFLARRSLKEIKHTRLLGAIAIASGPDSKEWGSHITSLLNKYADSALFLSTIEEDKDLDLHKEYEVIKNHRPTIEYNDKGIPRVRGID